jgi:hypothetical protein
MYIVTDSLDLAMHASTMPAETLSFLLMGWSSWTVEIPHLGGGFMREIKLPV